MKTLIKGGHVVSAGSRLNDKRDILIENGKISGIEPKIDDIEDIAGAEVIDAKGKYVLPGFVDMHCHLRDPGFEYKEDIESGTKSAAAGGFTSIACMPNTNPVVDNQSVINYIIEKAEKDGVVNVYPIGAITKGQLGEELAEIGEMKFAGAVGISDDGNSIKNSAVMKRALQYASMFDIIVISHCEDTDLSEGGYMNEGVQSTLMGLKGIPSAAEEIIVSRDIILSEYTNAPVHIAHVSTALSVDLIRNAKKRGVKVTAETCPHYFTLTEEVCEGFNTFAKVYPPLRRQKDLEAVMEGLKDGTIDVIATDHAPHHIDEKNVEFGLAANGFIGFETAFSLAVTRLLKTGCLDIMGLVEKMCFNPSRLLGLNKGCIEKGRSADITIVDLDENYKVDVSKFKSKAKNSPFNGFNMFGTVLYTIVGGKTIVREKILL